jgi:uncharacterized protein (UPF0332 family)
VSLAEDLLEQAGHLLVRDAGRPRQASLRRAISTAYYSLFHLIVDDAVSLLVRGSQLRSAVARSFDHRNLRSAAQAIREAFHGPDGTHGLRPFLRPPVSQGLAELCGTFVNLQEQRHRADYDTAQRFTRVDTATLVEDTSSAHATWRGERSTHNAQVFVLASARLIGTR